LHCVRETGDTDVEPELDGIAPVVFEQPDLLEDGEHRTGGELQWHQAKDLAVEDRALGAAEHSEQHAHRGSSLPCHLDVPAVAASAVLDVLVKQRR
jgi:hypothetical protein